MIGKIQRVPLREVWKHEAFDFTRWLEENLDVLNDVLDLSLANAKREQAAGDFSVDLVAEDGGGNIVVIENQLEKSNHDHLGKLITYLSAMGAKIAIWIVSDPRPEHVQAITWLNESSAAAFYLLKIEGIKIANSVAAPLLTLIVGPSEEGRKVGELKKELADTDIARKRFWTSLLQEAKKQTPLHANINPGINQWIETSAGKRGLRINYVILKSSAAVELYIDRGKDADAENKAIFDRLRQSLDEIEKAYGGPLDWQRLDGKRACRIKKDLPGGGLIDEARWPEIQKNMIEAMIRFQKALKPFIDKLD
jgi:hypothetical protein